MATQVGLFGIVVGIALLLSGLGFAILAVGGALRNRDSVRQPASGHATAARAPGPPPAPPARSPAHPGGANRPADARRAGRPALSPAGAAPARGRADGAARAATVKR